MAAWQSLFDPDAGRVDHPVPAEAAAALIIELIYRQDYRRIIILKARQLAMSTCLGVICADRLCFGQGQQLSLIDQTLEDARQKLRDITLVAYESTRSNTGELAVKFVDGLTPFCATVQRQAGNTKPPC
jgi:hypothetical protein